MKKIFLLIFILITSMALTACGFGKEGENEAEASEDNGKIKIVATLFPQYDFARQIAGDKAEITLLLPPGVESHSFEPTINDMTNIHDADVFLYTGDYMEPWAKEIISGVDNSELIVVDCSAGIELKSPTEGDYHEGEHHEGEESTQHNHRADPHFWLDPTLAMVMVDNITESLCKGDPENSDYYKQNASNYKGELEELDAAFLKTVSEAERNVLVFGGRFSYLYFIEHYGLEYVAAYDSCSMEAEPSVQDITEVIDFINENAIPCVYYEEFVEPTIAETIAQETGAEPLLFSTAHNVTKDEFEGGVTYLDIMYKNLENVGKGLN